MPGRAATTADFPAVYQECAAALRAFLAARAGRDQADDLAQEVWARALAKWSDFDGANAKAWLFRIAHNCLIDAYRKRRAEPAADLHRHADARVRPADAVALEAERHRLLAGCLQKLSPDFRAVAQALLGGDTADEIADRLSMNKATVYTRWHRAKELLQHCVNGAAP